MKKVLVLMFILIATRIWGYVFINTQPMGSKVYLDETLIGISPVVIKEDLTGTHELRFAKTDYFDFYQTVNLSGTLTNIYSYLTPRSFSLTFPNQHSVFIDDTEYDKETIYSMPDGFYKFETGTNYIKVLRTNPNRRLFWASVSVAVIGVANAVIGKINADKYWEKYQNSATPQELIDNLNNTTFWDNYSYVGMATAGIGLGAGLYFTVDAIRFKEKNEEMLIETVQSTDNDSDLYNDALDLSTSGEYEEALAIYDSLIENYSESKYKPLSLYRRAQIYSMLENYDSAAADMELILSDYPIYEIYSLTLKALGDIYYDKTDYLSAIVQYKELAELNPSYTETMEELIAESYTALLSGDNQDWSDEILSDASNYIDVDETINDRND